MIVLFNPRATKPRNRRLPLSVLALAAVLERREEYQIVDGNIEENPTTMILELIDQYQVELLGVTVMPGPQMVAAMETSREIRRLRPKVPIVWGGYFPSIYPDAALNARYVDFAVRGQGEDTLLELLEACRKTRICAHHFLASGPRSTTPALAARSVVAFAGYTLLTAPAKRWKLRLVPQPFSNTSPPSTVPTQSSFMT